MSDYASESGHWYQSDGTPRYTITGSNGQERDTTLRDAKKLNLYPGITTVTGIPRSYPLEKYKAEQLLFAGLDNPRLDDESREDWLKRLWEISRQEAKKAADRGIEIHAAIERHLLGQPVEPAMQPFVDAAVAQLTTVWGKQQWSPERSFAHPLGYGGKIDLHSATGVVVDFKTKDGPLAGLKMYDNHYMQLAACAQLLNLRRPICSIVFVRRDEPEAELKLAADEDIDSGREQFNALLAYWQAKTGYRPK